MLSELTAARSATSVVVAPGAAEEAVADVTPETVVSAGEARIAAPAASVALFWRGRRAAALRRRRSRDRAGRSVPEGDGGEIALGPRVWIQLGWT